MKQPAYQWYPGDHRRDTAVQSCSFGARALWREMLDLMHDGEPRGYLTAGGMVITDRQLARMVGLSATRVRQWLDELEARKVFSRTEAGVIFSRRMVRDDESRRWQAEQGNASTRAPSGNRGGKTGALFNHLMKRFGGCLYCHGADALELHRIVPGRRGGLYEPGNVLLLCHDHHQDAGCGDLTVAAVLEKAGVATALDLFAGFTHPRYHFNTPPDTPPGSSPIPSAVALAVAVADRTKKRSGADARESNGRAGQGRATAPPAPPARLTADADPAKGLPPASPPSALMARYATSDEIRALPDVAKAFVRSFYPEGKAGSPEWARRMDVSTQLVRALNGGCRLDHRRTAFALGPERLARKIREVEEQGLRDPDKAIVVLLEKLHDTSDVTERERTDTREREIAEIKNPRSVAEIEAAEAWVAAHPDVGAQIERLVEEELTFGDRPVDPRFVETLRRSSRESLVMAEWRRATSNTSNTSSETAVGIGVALDA